MGSVQNVCMRKNESECFDKLDMLEYKSCKTMHASYGQNLMKWNKLDKTRYVSCHL